MTDHEQIPIADDLLAVMRHAASYSLTAGEKFITPRMIMIALLRDPAFAEPFQEVVDIEALEAILPDPEASALAELPEERMPEEEQPAFLRYDTLAFKDDTGKSTVWLSGEAHTIFLEGARHAKERYIPKDLLLGFVSEWRRQPQILRDIKIDGGKFSEVAFALP